MALWRANCWINLISICEIRTDSWIRDEVAATLTRITQSTPLLINTTEWAQRTGPVSQDARPHQSTLLYLPHSSASMNSPHLSAHLPWVLTHYWCCFESSRWSQCWGFVSTAHCTGKKGALACLPLCLPGLFME